MAKFTDSKPINKWKLVILSGWGDLNFQIYLKPPIPFSFPLRCGNLHRHVFTPWSFLPLSSHPCFGSLHGHFQQALPLTFLASRRNFLCVSATTLPLPQMHAYDLASQAFPPKSLPLSVWGKEKKLPQRNYVTLEIAASPWDIPWQQKAKFQMWDFDSPTERVQRRRDWSLVRNSLDVYQLPCPQSRTPDRRGEGLWGPGPGSGTSGPLAQKRVHGWTFSGLAQVLSKRLPRNFSSRVISTRCSEFLFKKSVYFSLWSSGYVE